MSEKHHNVLFVCTGNSARSIMAEALMNSLGEQQGFHAYSAGSQPRGSVHPWTLKTLEAHRLPKLGYRSKSWDEFAVPGAPVMDFVFTVCDQAAGETCPVWPGQPMTAHWGLPDPALVLEPESAIELAFLDTFITLKRRIELMLALPLASLERLAVQREVRDIGKR
jgi:arsenate reductase